MRSSRRDAAAESPGGLGRARTVAPRGARPGRGRAAGAAALTALAAAALLAAGTLLGGAVPAAAQSAIPVEVDGRTLELHPVQARGYPAVGLPSLLGGFFTEVAVEGGTVRAVLAGQHVILREGSPFFRYAGRVHQLSNPPYRADGTLHVPLELVTDWWPRIAAGGAELAELSGSDEEVPTANRRPGPWRVVIDAGHGGKDPGTRGRRGTREKDVVLDIARRVARELEARPGFQPILTRDRDDFVELRERSRLAVQQEGDLFLSIHANAAPDRRARGFETYFLGEARSEEARRVAMRENAALHFESNGQMGDKEVQDLEFILAGLDRSQWVRQSSRLGGFIQNALRSTESGPDRGVKPGPYWVLVGASGSMPAVLVEVGFLSHPDEERELADAARRQRLAASIAEAVVEYFEDYARRVGVPLAGE